MGERGRWAGFVFLTTVGAPIGYSRLFTGAGMRREVRLCAGRVDDTETYTPPPVPTPRGQRATPFRPVHYPVV